MVKGSKLQDFNHYDGGMTQHEVAAELGFSQQYIQQIEKAALAKFRKNYIEMFGTPDIDGFTDEEFFKTFFSFDKKYSTRNRISILDYCELYNREDV